MSPLEAVIFDVDGTLVDSERDGRSRRPGYSIAGMSSPTDGC